MIRSATLPADLQAVRALLYEYGEIRNFDAALGDYTAELAGLPGKYAPPAGCLLLAIHSDTPTGCVAFRRLTETHCEMKRLFVRPDFRGEGIGKALVEALLHAAHEAGYQVMRLDTHPSMYTAQAPYLDCGFVEIERYNDNPTPGIRFFEQRLGEEASGSPS